MGYLSRQLYKAIKVGDSRELVRLLKRGACVRLSVLVATQSNKIEMIQELVNYGANVNEQGLDGSTALHEACFMGRTAIALHLVDLRGSIYIRNGQRKSPIDLLISTDYKGVDRMVLHYAAVNRAWLARRAFLEYLISLRFIQQQISPSSDLDLLDHESVGTRVMKIMHREIMKFL